MAFLYSTRGNAKRAHLAYSNSTSITKCRKPIKNPAVSQTRPKDLSLCEDCVFSQEMDNALVKGHDELSSKRAAFLARIKKG